MVFFNREIQPPDNELLTMLESIGRQIGQFIMRKRAETQLHKLSQAAEQSPSTIILTDTNGYIRYANLRFTQLTGYTLDEVIGETPSFSIQALPHGKYTSAYGGTIASGEERDGEVISKKKNRRILSRTGTHLLNKRRKRRHYELPYNRRRYHVAQSGRRRAKATEKPTVSYSKAGIYRPACRGIAHDFNNIIMAIMGYANFLKLELGEDNPLSQYPVKLLAVAERAEKLTSGTPCLQ